MTSNRQNCLQVKTLVRVIILFLVVCFSQTQIGGQTVATEEADTALDEQTYIVDKDIFHNKEAADLVRKARENYDLRSGSGAHKDEDRDKAIEIYQQAMEAEPGADINAVLALRIAQHYSLFDTDQAELEGGPQFGIGNPNFKPDHHKALEWFQRAVSLSKPIHQVWGFAQMSLANTLVKLNKNKEAIAAYERILEMAPEKMELPPWRHRPANSTRESQAELQQELKAVRENVDKMRNGIVDRIYYVATHLADGRKAAVAQMQRIMQDYQGTPMAERASKLLERAGGTPLAYQRPRSTSFYKANSRPKARDDSLVGQSLGMWSSSPGFESSTNQGAVNKASNLLGIERTKPELSSDGPVSAPLDEGLIREALAKMQPIEQGSLSRTKAQQGFRALPAWGQTGNQSPSKAGLTEPKMVSEATATDEIVEQKAVKTKGPIEEPQGESDLPRIVGVYEQMKAEVGGKALTNAVDPSSGKDAQATEPKAAQKMRVYNTFVSQRGGAFEEHMARGEALLKKGSYYRAAKAYEMAIGLETQNPLGYLGRAYSLAGAGELRSSIRSLSRALQIFPEQAQTKINLRAFFSSQGEIDRITNKLNSLVVFGNRDVGISLLLGYIYHYSGKSIAAGPILAQAAERAKTDPNVWPELAENIARFAQAVAK